ncbi:MAG: methylglyoxal synthase [Firmicutes bacterium]|nr:methylglyoxal synthase [Candidatus Alectryobacillus merdavium]
MKIALVAHDKEKEEMIEFASKHKDFLSKHELYATGTTGRLVSLATGLKVTCMKSGPLGGDQQIGSLIAENKLDLVVFLRDPLTAQPHEPDVNALLRLCDVTKTIVATNITTANLIIKQLESEQK